MLNSQSNLGLVGGDARAALGQRAKELGERLQHVGRSRPFVAVVAIAAIVFGLYYFVIASPMYVSEASFSLRGRDQGSALGSAAGLLAAVGGGASPSGTEAAELQQYVQSWDMLSKLDQRLHLKELYSRPTLDIFHSLPRNPHKEEFLGFYRKMVKVEVQRDTNIIKVSVRSFDAASAPKIANAIVELAGVYVDNLSTTIHHDTVKTAEKDLQEAEKAVRDSRLAMAAYRSNTGMVDPTVNAGQASGSIVALQNQILATRAELAQLLTYNQPNSPLVVQGRARIAAMEKQIAELQSKLATKNRDDTLSQRLYEFEGLKVSNEYAEKQLVAAMGAYDSARAMATQRERFLVPVVATTVPDHPTLPHRLLAFLEAMIVTIAAYGILALAIAGVRDHQGI